MQDERDFDAEKHGKWERIRTAKIREKQKVEKSKNVQLMESYMTKGKLRKRITKKKSMSVYLVLQELARIETQE